MNSAGNNEVGMLGRRFHALLSHGLVAVLLLAVSGRSLAGLADGYRTLRSSLSIGKRFSGLGTPLRSALSRDGNTLLVGASGRINISITIVPILIKFGCRAALAFIKEGAGGSPAVG